jgi:hypothetical protein
MQVISQSTITTILVGPVLDASGIAVTTAAIGDFNITKNGTSAAMSANTIEHSHNGHYTIVLTAANTDTLGRLTITVNNAAMAMAPFRFTVLTAAAFDALVTNGNIASTTSGRTIAVSAAGAATAALDSASITAVQSGLATSASITTLRGADNDTLKTLSDQIDGIGGGGGGDAEQDTLLEVQTTVNALALSLAGSSVTVTSRVSGSEITAYIGDDYKVRSGTELEITVSDTAGALHTKLAAIGVSNLYFGASLPRKDPGQITGTISSLSYAANVLTIAVEITACASGLTTGDYTYQIQSSQAQSGSYDDYIELEGTLVVKQRTVAVRG